MATLYADRACSRLVVYAPAQAPFVALEPVTHDTDAFNRVMEAMRLPKGTPDQQAERDRAIEEANKTAAAVPLQTATGREDRLAARLPVPRAPIEVVQVLGPVRAQADEKPVLREESPQPARRFKIVRMAHLARGGIYANG